jgi:hypothetical protein
MMRTAVAALCEVRLVLRVPIVLVKAVAVSWGLMSLQQSRLGQEQALLRTTQDDWQRGHEFEAHQELLRVLQTRSHPREATL